MTLLTAAHHPTAAPGLIWLAVVIVLAAYLTATWAAGKLRRLHKPRPQSETPVTGHVVAHPRADKTHQGEEQQ